LRRLNNRAWNPAPVKGHPNITPSIEKFPVGMQDFHGLQSDPKHLSTRILEVYQQPDVDLSDVQAEELIKLIEDKEIDWTPALMMGVDYYGNQTYKQPAQMKSNLNSLVNYVNSPKAAPDIKQKLLFVVKQLRTNRDALGCVVMMASHSGVCNVQKEIGVRLAYGAIAGVTHSEMDEQDPKNQTLRLLYECREMCIESLYCAQVLNGNKSLNSHPLMGYRNAIHDKIGLDIVPDPDTSNNAVALHYVETFFERFYTLEVMLHCILKALNDDRKLHYNSVVSFLQYNRPAGEAEKFSDAEEFLYHCFDEEGKFTMGAVAWLLYKMEILCVAPDKTVDLEALFPDMDESVVEEIRKSLSGMRIDNTPLKSSAEELKEELQNELKHSVEYALNHSCDHLNKSK